MYTSRLLGQLRTAVEVRFHLEQGTRHQKPTSWLGCLVGLWTSCFFHQWQNEHCHRRQVSSNVWHQMLSQLLLSHFSIISKQACHCKQAWILLAYLWTGNFLIYFGFNQVTYWLWASTGCSGTSGWSATYSLVGAAAVGRDVLKILQITGKASIFTAELIALTWHLI